MNMVVLLAGGTGSRMGMEIPKQFIEVEGKPIIVHTMQILEEHPKIDGIVAVCIAGWEEKLQKLAKEYGISKLKRIVTGGKSRFDSTRNGFEALEELAADDVIVIHDAARPLVTEECLTSVVEVCQREGNSMAVLECVDTMYEKTSLSKTQKVAERECLVRGQTPEAATVARFQEMYWAADVQKMQMDSISAMQIALGWDVSFAKGTEQNIKVTRPEDIEFFRAMLLARRMREK